MPQSRLRRATRTLAATLLTALLTGAILTSNPVRTEALPLSPVVSATPGEEKFFTLDSRSGWRLSNGSFQNPGAYIREVTYDVASDSFPRQGEVVGEFIDLPLRDEVSNTFRANVNALGVSPDGTFYFTTQLGDVAQQGTVDIWQYKPFDPAAGPATPVVEDFMLNSLGGGVIVGGAVNPRDEAYYFVYFSKFGSQVQATNAGTTDPSRWEETIRAHIYRYDATRTITPEKPAGEVMHLDFYRHSEFSRASSLNGDIAFDRQGNLHLVVSSVPTDGQPGVAALATLAYDEFGTLPNIDPMIGYAPVPTLSPTSMTGGAGQSPVYTVGTSGTYNGIAFAESGALIVGQGNRQTLSDPLTFGAVSATSTLTPQTNFSNVDLASASAPPTLIIEQVVVGNRLEAGDQFSLSATHTLPSGALNAFPGTQTTGTSPGTQGERMGPYPIRTDGVISVQSTPTAVDRYVTRYECVTLDASGVAQSAFLSGIGSSFSFVYGDAVPGAAAGAQAVTCVFTSEARRAALRTSKGSSPASGTALATGDELQYVLTFDNSAGTADALDIDYTDRLAAVLDDAEFAVGSVRYGDGRENEYPADGVTALGVTAVPLAHGDLHLTGAVPAGEIRTVWFAVTITSDDAGDVLVNHLVEGDAATPTQCAIDDALCTTHPIQPATDTGHSAMPPGPGVADTPAHPGPDPTDDAGAGSALAATGARFPWGAIAAGGVLLTVGLVLSVRGGRPARAKPLG